MRFLVMVKSIKERPANEKIKLEDVAEMGKFNETLSRDGIILGMGGLKPSSLGARISYAGGKPTVTDGPFTETKELVAGFWLLQGRSKEEIVERISRAPFEDGASVEIRPLYEDEDFEGGA